MNADDATLEVDGEDVPGRVNAPDDPSETGVLVVPGANHGPFGDVFDRFAEAAAGAGYEVARFEFWRDRDELAAKTEAELHDAVDAGVEFLRSRGRTTIAVVAKSFGGGLALARVPEAADRMVLWAPAIQFGDREDGSSVTAADLAGVDRPIRILHGDEDEVVPPENSAAIVEHLPRGELVELPGEDHSFLNDRERVVEETLAALPD